MAQSKRRKKRKPLSAEVRQLRRELFGRLDNVMLRDADRLRARSGRARSVSACEEIADDIDTAELRLELRDASVPQISYPDELPITHRLDDIRQQLLTNQVVIVAGETGSGKTTQLPKLCLELGFGRKGLIGHTQPRRIAARSVSERIADELGTSVGDLVGYTVRFTDEVSENTAVKVMTDGILLAEIRNDRLLRNYDVIIIDEAHERSLNIDFLLGYLKRILPERPDLRIIVTSATIETHRFAEHFAVADEPAPVVEVSGRTYPVEVRYRPGDEDQDPLENFLDAVTEIYTESHTEGGDILAFFPGEREIREAGDAIDKARFPSLEVLPLFGRLSSSEQHRVFSPHTTQRIILATNVAETSLTVPGIRYVIDSGVARISRYSHRTKIQRLPIEEISQASAKQRSGRCGRLSDGIAIRLYSEENYDTRPLYTEPEILRTNLASVILQMADLGFGSIEEFPFLDAPDFSSVKDGVQVLTELGALRKDMSLTRTGKLMARIPVDPRLARMMIEADRRSVLGDVLIIVAALSIRDVRERPTDKEDAADALHARFKNPKSDFLSFLQVWNYLEEKRRELSRSKFRKLCQREFLHWLRFWEWKDLVSQLSDICRQMGWKWDRHEIQGGVDENRVHQALLSGLLSNIGMRIGESREYQGTRGKKFSIFPASGIARKTSMLVAYEIVETSRVWGRTLAAINPEWAEKAAGPAVSRRYAEPHWSSTRGEALAYESTSLWGVPLVSDRIVSYRKVDPEFARRMFLINALVRDDWKPHYGFIAENQKTIDKLQQFEDKARQRGLVIDEDATADLYDSLIPENIRSANDFAQWWKKQPAAVRSSLILPEEKIRSSSSVGENSRLFPDTFADFELSYSFLPGTAEDGISVLIPVAELPRVNPDQFSWLVPGMRSELVLASLRSLPKNYRKQLIPLPDTAQTISARLPDEPQGNFFDYLANLVNELPHVSIPEDIFKDVDVPAHLRFRFVAQDESGNILDSDRDFGSLLQRQSGESASAIKDAFSTSSTEYFSEWTEDLGDIPRELSSGNVLGFPALARHNDKWFVDVYTTKLAAYSSQLSAVISLLEDKLPGPRRQLFNGISNPAKLALRGYPGGESALREDVHKCAIRDLVVLSGGPVWSFDGFNDLFSEVREKIGARERAIALLSAQAVLARLNVLASLPDGSGVPQEVEDQVEWLTSPGFVTQHGALRIKHIPRYLKAAQVRLDKAVLVDGVWVDEDSAPVDAFYRVEDALWEKVGAPSPDEPIAVKKVRWLLEEFKVSVFAQQMGTAEKVSEKRLLKEISQLD